MIGVAVPDSGSGLRGQVGEPDCDQQSADNAWSDATRVREADAARRDELADARDLVAEARDQVAGAADGKASALRDAAADDREHAADDRKHAAVDRRAASEELATAEIDYLTGVLRRRAGLAAIQREMDRTARTREPLVLAFIDVDGLKAINDIRGHPAADDILCEVARCVRESLRSYDVVVRFGGDEFVCSLAGQDATGAEHRLEQISAQLATGPNGPTFTAGVAERRADESLDELIIRADAAMLNARRRQEEPPAA